jgi:hypothetical protein
LFEICARGLSETRCSSSGGGAKSGKAPCALFGCLQIVLRLAELRHVAAARCYGLMKTAIIVGLAVCGIEYSREGWCHSAPSIRCGAGPLSHPAERWATMYLADGRTGAVSSLLRARSAS